MSTLRHLRWSIVFLVAASAASAEGFDIAITVDDLPFNGQLPPGMTRLGIAQAYLATVKAHGVPEAYGFINASKFDKEPGSESVLATWRKAGYPLGNHGYTHLNLERAPSLAAWQADVEANEPVLKQYMGNQDWHWFRFPNLAVGTRRDEALAYLAQRGYREADVSVAFGDWTYSDAYARCTAKGDNATIAAMKDQYLRNVDRGIAAMKAQSKQVYGRVIPQVLLTHLAGWSAVTMDDVLKRLDAAGARYVSLEQASADPAYALHGGGSLIARAAREKGVKLEAPPRDTAQESELDPKNACR